MPPPPKDPEEYLAWVLKQAKRKTPVKNEPYQDYFELTGIHQGSVIPGLGKWSWIRIPYWSEGVAGWN